MANEVYLALGSNLGNKKENIQTALVRLAAKIEIKQRSAYYDTAPAGNTNQPRFLNMVCSGETIFSPSELLLFVKKMETDMGRQPGPVNSPRPIDIDILFYDELVINTPQLVIPHPRLMERIFVLLPLSEIAPDLKHPVNGKTVKEMLGELKWTEQDISKITER